MRSIISFTRRNSSQKGLLRSKWSQQNQTTISRPWSSLMDKPSVAIELFFSSNSCAELRLRRHLARLLFCCYWTLSLVNPVVFILLSSGFAVSQQSVSSFPANVVLPPTGAPAYYLHASRTVMHIHACALHFTKSPNSARIPKLQRL
jgi:hypothetical protein